jgi:HEXXH motif-containing protein
MVVEDDFHSIFEFPRITSTEVQPFAAALDVLSLHVPEYLEWVQGVLRGVLVCRCDHSRTRSSSWMHAPGIVLVSWSADPVAVAEMLVHESSHQYFHLLSRLGRVDDGSDVREYFSPAVQRSRPLSKILIGYHAFANVLLFYQALLRNGFANDPHCRATEERLCHDVELLALPLRDNPALTQIGRDMTRPLMEHVRESRLSRVNA